MQNVSSGARRRTDADPRAAGRTPSPPRGDLIDRARSFVRRHPVWTAIGLGILHLALALAAFVPTPHPGGDNAVYLSLARSILDGGYRDVFDPAAPVHAQFPPGWPLMVAIGLKLGLKPWAGMKLIVVACSAVAVALTYLWVRARRRPGLALGVGLLAAVSPGVLALSHWELSDVPFWMLTTAALLAWERLPRGRPGRTAGASTLTVAAYLVRSAGIPLLVAAGAWLAWRRRWRELAIYLAVALPPVIAWSVWTRAQGGYVSFFLMANPYAPALGTVDAAGLAARAGENVVLYARDFLPTLLGGSVSTPLIVLSVAVFLLAIYGWAMRLRRPGAAEVWVPLYVAMFLAWSPQWAGDRLLLPLFPALLMYAGDGLARIGRRMGGRAAWMPALAAAVLMLAALPGVLAAARDGAACRSISVGDKAACLEPSWRDFLEIAEVARDVLPPGSVVLSRKPPLFHVVSGLPGRTYPPSREPAALFAAAREAGARYVVLDALDQLGETYLVPILIRRPQAFCIVRSLGASRATLLGILPDAERIPDQRDDPGAAEMSVGFRPCGPEYARPEAP